MNQRALQLYAGATTVGSTFTGSIAQVRVSTVAAHAAYDVDTTHILTTAANSDLQRGRLVGDTDTGERWLLTRPLSLPPGFEGQARWQCQEEARS